MDAVTLTPQQHDAVDWLVAEITAGSPVIALRGLAGTGKTSVIPALCTALTTAGLLVTVGAPTHRAAHILRTKGLLEADTVHAHALMPFFTADYRRAVGWLGGTLPMRLEEMGSLAHAHPDILDLPYLVYEAVQPDLDKGYALQRLPAAISPKRRLGSLGIHGKDFFAGFGPKVKPGVLIIDEASMVGKTMLRLCQEAFRQIILVGDPGQLPPVKDTAVLPTVPGIDLTAIHRQAADSPILRLAYQAREGHAFWTALLQQRHATFAPLGVSACGEAPATAFVDAPLIVWRNLTRVASTHAIRKALGYTKGCLYPGEPLVCRATSPEDRADGFYNNALYRVVMVEGAGDSREVVIEDALGESSQIPIHLEELDGQRIPYRAIPFRFGYCLTAHTAQGGEWPAVYISAPDLVTFAARCQQAGRLDELAQWTYTAITRAKTTLGLLTHHTFVAQKERTMATKTQTPVTEDLLTSSPPAPVGGGLEQAREPLEHPREEPADIVDPPVPVDLQHALVASTTVPEHFGAHEALLHGFCQHLQARLHTFLLDEHTGLMQTLDATLVAMKKWVEVVGQHNEHAQYSFSDALAKLQEHGLVLVDSPYQAQLRVLTPAGYPLTLTVTRATSGALIEELGRLEPWLQGHGYKAGV